MNRGEEAGEYAHHAVSTLSFKIKRHLNLDVSFVWDFTQHPQTESSGEEPKKSDYYLTVGLGARFKQLSDLSDKINHTATQAPTS